MIEATLTPGQEKAVEKIDKFLKSDQKFFRLVGPAGYGKTFVIQYALKKYLDEDRQKNFDEMPNVVGIAVAHKAKNVLIKAKIPCSRTFASAYGFKEVQKEDGSIVFEANPFPEEKPIGHLDIPIFVHDEVSQYSYEMMKIVFEKTSIFSKVIFMGDNAQLSPIDPKMAIDADSPIFDLVLPDFCQHELTESVRQEEGNPILELSRIVREEIFGRKDLNRIIGEILRPRILDNKGILCIPENHLYGTYIEQESYIDNKIIAFRKDKVAQTNLDIRNIIFPGEERTLVENDFVFMTKNYKSEKPSFTIHNSDEYIIREIDIVNYEPPNCLSAIECYFGIIDHPNSNARIMTPTENGIEMYNYNLRTLIHNAKQNKKLWKEKKEFSDAFTEFTLGYSINAYRSQGSTYKNVFIDLVDILTTRPLTPKRKLQTIYTALTRATDVAYFIKP